MEIEQMLSDKSTDDTPFLKVSLISTNNSKTKNSKNSASFSYDPKNDINVRHAIDSDFDTPNEMWTIVDQLTANRSRKDKFLVFIHGYNNTSNYASDLLRKLDRSLDNSLGSDSSGRLVSVMYDWDGKTNMLDISRAWDNAMASIEWLTAFVILMYKKGFRNIIFVAHSLGNVVLTEAIKHICDIKHDPDDDDTDDDVDDDDDDEFRINYQQIFKNCQFVSFASACYKEQLIDAIKYMNGNYKRWISYFHYHDVALAAEGTIIRAFHDKMRKAGSTVMGNHPIYDLNTPKFECVDCTVLNKITFDGLFDKRIDIKNHSYFLHPSVLLDVSNAVLEEQSAANRGLERTNSDDGTSFHWKISSTMKRKGELTGLHFGRSPIKILSSRQRQIEKQKATTNKAELSDASTGRLLTLKNRLMLEDPSNIKFCKPIVIIIGIY